MRQFRENLALQPAWRYYFWQGKKSEDAYDKLRNDVTASTGEAPNTTAPETTNNRETKQFIPDPKEKTAE